MRELRGYAILALIVLMVFPLATMGGAASGDGTAGTLKTIVISPHDASVKVTGAQTFTATGLDEKGNPVDIMSVNWSVGDASYGEIASINETAAGFKAGTKAGSVKVFASVGKVSGNVSVSIIAGDPVELSVAPAKASVAVTGAIAFSATAKDEFGNVVPGDEYAWNSTQLIYGYFKSKHGARSVFVAGTLAGKTTLSVEAGPLKATATVTIFPGGIYSVRIFPNEIEVDSMDTATFQAQVVDPYGNILPGKFNFTWLVSHSFARIANISGNNVTISVGQIGGGNEVLTASLGENLSAKATVKVRPAIWFMSTIGIAFLTVLITFLVRYKTRTRCPECGAPHWTFAEKCKVCDTPMVERRQQ